MWFSLVVVFLALSLKLDYRVEMNIASWNGVKKNLRDKLFDVLIKIKNSLARLSVLVADGLFLDVLLGANWLKASGAHLGVS